MRLASVQRPSADALRNCCPLTGKARRSPHSTPAPPCSRTGGSLSDAGRLPVERLISQMPRFRKTVPIDDYVLDVLMRDLVGHDRQPAAFLVYLYLFREAGRQRWQPVSASLRMIAEGTGLSKSAVQVALQRLRTRDLIQSKSEHATALPQHRVLRHWRQVVGARNKRPRKAKRPQS